MRPASTLLVCIYTCEQHRHLLERFYASDVGRVLRDIPGSRMLEVYADPDASRSHMEGRRMVLRTPESYPDLVLKTQRMIEFCVREFRFDNLLKIDITTVLRDDELGTPEYAERKALDLGDLARFLRTADSSLDYNGFIHHASAGRAAAEGWARKKGLEIDYSHFFGDGPMVPYYSGKCYLLSRRFAEFIAERGAAVAVEHQRLFPAAEDLMVGRMHEQFRQAPAA